MVRKKINGICECCQKEITNKRVGSKYCKECGQWHRRKYNEIYSKAYGRFYRKKKKKT